MRRRYVILLVAGLLLAGLLVFPAWRSNHAAACPAMALDLWDKIDEGGVVPEDIGYRPPSGAIKLHLTSGTTAPTEGGKPLQSVGVQEAVDVPSVPPSAHIVGLGDDFHLDDATFDPPISITMQHDPSLIPEGVAEEEVVDACYDVATGESVQPPSTARTENNTIESEALTFTRSIPSPTPTPAPTPTPIPMTGSSTGCILTPTPAPSPVTGSSTGCILTPTPAPSPTTGNSTGYILILTPTPAPSPTPTPTPIPTPAPTLDPIRTDGSIFLDSSGRTVILRGFVTITHGSAGSVDYTLEDYERMASIGANYQSLRVFAQSIGAWPGTEVGPYYMTYFMNRLDNMVSMAKEVGMYTEFKLTMYGTPEFDWTDLWLNENGEQELIIEKWKGIWERYKDEPSVVGYDLLNEPEKGDLEVSDEVFVRDYLTPFYRNAVDELGKIGGKLAFFQPQVHLDPYAAVPYGIPIDRDNLVYTPHFYPNIYSYDTSGYGSMMQRFISEARVHNAPLFIGEYGVPWNANNDGDTVTESAHQATERAAVSLFDASSIGFSRPWFADDTSKVSDILNWALIKGTSLDGPGREFIMDVISRPYPQRISGVLNSFSYDTESNEFTMTYAPDGSLGTTTVFVPGDRHFSDGFTVEHSEGIVLAYDSSSSSLKPVSGDNTERFHWNETNSTLSIAEWLSGESVVLEIKP